MQITAIELFDCELRRHYPGMRFNPILIRILTDAGISGIGEVGLAYGAGAKAGAGMVRDFAPFVLGKDPMKSEAIWECLFRSTFWGMGGGPVVYGAMSAIDIALWDIRGKALERADLATARRQDQRQPQDLRQPVAVRLEGNRLPDPQRPEGLRRGRPRSGGPGL